MNYLVVLQLEALLSFYASCTVLWMIFQSQNLCLDILCFHDLLCFVIFCVFVIFQSQNSCFDLSCFCDLSWFCDLPEAKICVLYLNCSAREPRGCFLGKMLVQTMVYSKSEVPTFAGRAQEEGNGCVFLDFQFQTRNGFGFLQSVLDPGSAVISQGFCHCLEGNLLRCSPIWGHLWFSRVFPAAGMGGRHEDISGLGFRCLFHTLN